MRLRERFFGLLLIGVGLVIFFLLFAFWRSGFDTPVDPPLPPALSPSMAFAFNPLVCAVPFIALGALGLILEGLRRVLSPDS